MNSSDKEKHELLEELAACRRRIAELEEQTDLKHWQELMHYIIQHDPNAVAVLDKEMNYIFVSKRFLEDYAVKEEDVIGKNHYAVFPEISDKWKNIHKRSLNGEVVREENDEFLRKDGSVDYISWESRPWYLGKNKIGGIILYTEVITKRKTVEKELQKSEERFRNIVESVPDPVVIQSELKFAFLNPAACRLFGVSNPGDLIGKPVMERFHPDYHHIIRERIRVLNEERKPVHEPMEYRIISMNGKEIWIETTGEPILFEGMQGALVVMRDISHRKKVQKDLSESEERIRYALKVSQIGVWEFYMADQSAYRSVSHDLIFGYSEAVPDWSYKIFLSHVHPDDRDSVKEKFREALERNQDWKFECRIFRKDGELRWIWAAGRPMADDEGNLNRIIGIVQDITDRKNAESTLESSYTLLRFAGKIARFGGWTIDLGGDISDISNRLVEWSDAVAEIHETPKGYSPSVKDAIGFYAPEYREEVSHAFTECAVNGIPYDEEMEILTKKGNRKWIRTIGEAVREDGIIVRVQGAFQDITVLRQTEKKLIESETKFRKLFQNHSAIKLIIDPETGNITEANDAAEAFYGWKAEEMKNMNIKQINILSDEEIEKEMHRASLALNTHFYFRHCRADGSVKDVEVFSSKIEIGGKVFLHSIIHDVTEKKKAEEQLRLLSRSVEQSPVAIEITDINGRIKYVNPAFEATTGFKLEEIKEKNPRILKSGYQGETFYKDLWETILAGKEWTGEIRNRKKNGKLYWEEAVISPIFNENGDIVNFVAIKEDITERKKMVEDLVAAKEKAEESDRLKSSFLANMSHEIRTPMSGILGFAGLLKEPGISGETQQRYISIIQDSGNRMLDTLNDLIDIAKIETGQVKVHLAQIDLNEQIENLYNFFSPMAASKGIELIFKDRVPSDASVLITDRAKLDSIFTNLIKNAIKFTDEGKIEIGCELKDGYLEFYISDTGIGVPVEKWAAIFNRFEHADIEHAKIFQGSGLGLAISKAYVEMLGGKIWLHSREGEGSVFYFTIPATGSAENNPDA